MASGGKVTWKTRREYDLMMAICAEHIRPAELDLFEDIGSSLDEVSVALERRHDATAVSHIAERLCASHMCEGHLKEEEGNGRGKKGKKKGGKGGKKGKKRGNKSKKAKAQAKADL